MAVHGSQRPFHTHYLASVQLRHASTGQKHSLGCWPCLRGSSGHSAQDTGWEFTPTGWTSNGPESNLEGGATRGGRVDILEKEVIVKSGVWRWIQAAAWSTLDTSTPSLNFTPVITLARSWNPRNRRQRS